MWRRLRRLPRILVIAVLVLAALFAAGWLASGDVRYIARAAVAEAGILARRRPIERVVADSTTDAATRGKLLLVLAARSYAADSLGLAAGRTYTTYSPINRDTLVLVLSAAPADRLQPYTWRYPIVGRVPYKGFFSFDLAARESRKLEGAGLDVYLRVANAFSTLGWFNDPLLSTIVREDSVDLAATVIHEIFHNTLFIPGQVDFDESVASFVGYHGAAALFRSRGDSANAARAAARWRDEVRLSRFYAALAERLERLYSSGRSGRALFEERNRIFRAAADEMAGPLAAQLETISGRRLAERPLNNAVVLAHRAYVKDLERFDSLLAAEGGDLERTIAVIRRRTAGGGDPWAALGGGRRSDLRGSQ